MSGADTKYLRAAVAFLTGIPETARITSVVVSTQQFYVAFLEQDDPLIGGIRSLEGHELLSEAEQSLRHQNSLNLRH